MARLAVLALCALPAVALWGLPVPAHAAWTRVGGTHDSIVYLDKASIQRGDSGRRADSLESFRTPQTAPDGKPYLSVAARHLYDCANRSVTLLSQSFYPEKMGKGETVGTYKYEAFDAEPVDAGSRYAQAMNTVCGKAKPSAPTSKRAP